MYVLLIFHDQECSLLNAIWLYDTIRQIMDDTNGIIKYSDINKKVRIYKTAKSFFRILKISREEYNTYFKRR